jgi:hypothetical protein
MVPAVLLVPPLLWVPPVDFPPLLLPAWLPPPPDAPASSPVAFTPSVVPLQAITKITRLKELKAFVMGPLKAGPVPYTMVARRSQTALRRHVVSAAQRPYQRIHAPCDWHRLARIRNGYRRKQA